MAMTFEQCLANCFRQVLDVLLYPSCVLCWDQNFEILPLFWNTLRYYGFSFTWRAESICNSFFQSKRIATTSRELWQYCASAG